jgi:hypothetical protein
LVTPASLFSFLLKNGVRANVACLVYGWSSVRQSSSKPGFNITLKPADAVRRKDLKSLQLSNVQADL